MGESPASEEKKEHESPVLTHLPMCDGCGWMDSLLGNYYKLKFYILSNSYVYALTPCMMVCTNSLQLVPLGDVLVSFHYYNAILQAA